MGFVGMHVCIGKQCNISWLGTTFLGELYLGNRNLGLVPRHISATNSYSEAHILYCVLTWVVVGGATSSRTEHLDSQTSEVCC